MMSQPMTYAQPTYAQPMMSQPMTYSQPRIATAPSMIVAPSMPVIHAPTVEIPTVHSATKPAAHP